MRIKLFDVQVRVYEDRKQVYPATPAPSPAKPPPTAGQSFMIGLGLAVLIVAAFAFLAWWDGFLPA